MPYFRHSSFVFAPASASLSTPMICSSMNLRLFFRLLLDEQTLLHSGTNLGEQTNTKQPCPFRKFYLSTSLFFGGRPRPSVTQVDLIVTLCRFSCSRNVKRIVFYLFAILGIPN